MSFSEKLKKAMHDLELNQRQVCGLTGKSKGSVSQYLSGKQIPSEAVQRDIAIALGLAEDFFCRDREKVDVLPKKERREGIIPRRAYSRGGTQSIHLTTDGCISSMRNGFVR